MIVVHDLAQQRRVAVVRGKRVFETRNGALFRQSARRRPERRRAVVQQLESVAEAHAVEPLNELDRIARLPAAQTVEESLFRRHDERGFLVVVERATANQVPASVLRELDAARADQRRQVHRTFQPVDFVVRDSRHSCTSVFSEPRQAGFRRKRELSHFALALLIRISIIVKQDLQYEHSPSRPVVYWRRYGR